MRFNLKFFLIFFISLLFFWGMVIEPSQIKVEEVEIKIKNLPGDFENLKIIQLSDLHCKKFKKREEKILKIVKNLNPDYIFLTGDIVDWATKNFDSCQIFWRELSKNFSVFAVFGNHDHRNLNFKNLKKILTESGIPVLDNQSQKLKRGKSFIYLLGVDDPHLGYDNLELAMAEIKENKVKILLAHSPEIFSKAKEKDIDLVLSGHTHGGQINIPFLVDLILPLKYDKKYKRGLFQENSHSLYVSRGLGTTFLPIRINSFPEITFLRLKLK